MSIVEITNSDYLKLLLNTASEHQDFWWCLKTKLQLRKMRSISGYAFEEQLIKVDKKFKEINEIT